MDDLDASSLAGLRCVLHLIGSEDPG